MSCAILYNGTTVYNFTTCNSAVGNPASVGNNQPYEVYILLNNKWIKQRNATTQTTGTNYSQYSVIDFESLKANPYALDSLILPATILACACFWFIYKMIWGARYAH